ncbi:MFS transporter [Streptomyces formicae]|uniref:Major facilitator superfamily MFS_1 n=1 Tax=Streptomyces formicae TaxID=1616117 RepID=A0A291Q1Y3_9ACTN|nr:MFS transporter [Streptomyces formicae]ATL25729.1 major facilitator superfamily MFS_1 [Streptomyces formicae]
MTGPPGTFTRDSVTGMAYGGLALYAYVLYVQGPLLPLLREETHLSYAAMSAHSTLFAAGGIVTNLLYARVSARLGGRRLFWAAAGALAASALLLALGAWAGVAYTLAASLAMGVTGATLQTATASALSDHHGPHRERALVEANAGASATALIAPLAVGAFQAGGPGWRAALVVPLLAGVVLYVACRKVPFGTVPAAGSTDRRKDGRGNPGPLPARFRLLCTLLGIVVGLEFCVVFYGAPHLSSGVGLSADGAATAMSLFAAGALAGRLVGSSVARPGRARRLVVAALAVTGAGFLPLWAATAAPVALVALFVTGFGVANLFPLVLSLAIEVAPDQSDRITARVYLTASTAIMCAPLLLGALSDRIGVRPAFGVTALLIAVAALLVLLDRAPRTPPSTTPRPAAERSDPTEVTS